MASIATAVLDIKQLELLAHADSPIHRLDARAKVLVTIIFCSTIISFGRYDLSALLPFFVFPAVMIARGNLPFLLIARKIALLCPFVLIVAMFNPILDRGIGVQLGPLAISAGWISFCSILVRSILTVGAGLILVGVTGFTSICRALEKFGIPQAFAVQLLFLYRYIFVLAEEGSRVSRARELRSSGRKGLGVSSYASMIGYLLLRTWSRAERIHMAMLARGFNGEFRTLQTSRLGSAEVIHIAGWTAAFMIMRFVNCSHLVGQLFTGGIL